MNHSCEGRRCGKEAIGIGGGGGGGIFLVEFFDCFEACKWPLAIS